MHDARVVVALGTLVGKRINQALDEAERAGRCLAPASRADERWLQRSVKRGEMVRPRRGLYARSSYWGELDSQQRTLHILAALASKHPDWIFAGTSAAVVHGMEVGESDAERLCVATSERAHTCTRGSCTRIIVSHDTPVCRNDITVTSFARTVYDCLRMLPFPAALAIADSALRGKGIDRERLARNVVMACGYRKGTDRVLSIIALADGKAENGGESKVRASIISCGFVVPALQYEVSDPLDETKGYRVDFAWELPDGSYVFGELDGKEKYVNPQMTGGDSIEDLLLKERRRESRITLANTPIRIMRFSFAEACNHSYFTRLLDAYGVPHAETVPEVSLT